MPQSLDRIRCTVNGAPGTGAVTILAAVDSTWRKPAVGDDGKAFTMVLTETGVGSEVCATIYTHTSPATSLSRGALASGSSRLSFTSAATVMLVASSDMLNNYTRLQQMVTPGGRLTLESGVPVSTTDQTAKTSIFYTPYLHNGIVLWDGTDWLPITFSETTLALGTLTSGRPYDVFAYLSSGVLTLEPFAWTNDTARATAITLQDGRYCKSGDKTRLYLGTFYTTSTTTTADTQMQRLVWNAYNRAPRGVRVTEATVSWSYSSTTLRYAQGSSANRIEFVKGIAGDTDRVDLAMFFTGSASQVPISGVGFDSSTTRIGRGANGTGFGAHVRANTAAADSPYVTLHEYTPGAGFHFYAWVESVAFGGAGAQTFIGNNECGLVGKVLA